MSCTADITVSRHSSSGIVTAWRVHLWAIVITLVAELVGQVTLPVGPVNVVLFPLVWGMILGCAVSVISTRMSGRLALTSDDQFSATGIIQVAVLLFVAKQALLVGASLPRLFADGWALCFQELGHFFGTILLALPLALLLGIKREAIGATFSVGREQNLAIIGERFGLTSPEGRGVMAEYITGTVLGAVFIALVASVVAGTGWFNPVALGMASGVGSGSMMAAAASAVTAYVPQSKGADILSFASASNLVTTTVGTYFTTFVSLPMTILAYRILEPKIGRLTGRSRDLPDVDVAEASLVSDNHAHAAIPFLSLSVVLVFVTILALFLGNAITYNVYPSHAVCGAALIVLTALLGEAIRRVIPWLPPTVICVAVIGMLLTAPVWPGSSWVNNEASHVNFLALSTPLLTYAGISVAKELGEFRKLGWRIVLVSLVANAGTFIFAALVAEFFV